MTTPAWTNPPTVAVGHVETETEINALIGAGGDLEFLHVAKGVRLRSSADQSLTSSSMTALTFDTEDFDLFGCHESVTHPSRITVPSALAGIWIVRAQVEFAANATGLRELELAKNGTAVVGPVILGANASGTTTVQICSSFSLSASDYLELLAEQTSGGALNVDHGSALTFFEATWVGVAS